MSSHFIFRRVPYKWIECVSIAPYMECLNTFSGGKVGRNFSKINVHTMHLIEQTPGRGAKQLERMIIVLWLLVKSVSNLTDTYASVILMKMYFPMKWKNIFFVFNTENFFTV